MFKILLFGWNNCTTWIRVIVFRVWKCFSETYWQNSANIEVSRLLSLIATPDNIEEYQAPVFANEFPEYFGIWMFGFHSNFSLKCGILKVQFCGDFLNFHSRFQNIFLSSCALVNLACHLSINKTLIGWPAAIWRDKTYFTIFLF